MTEFTFAGERANRNQRNRNINTPEVSQQRTNTSVRSGGRVNLTSNLKGPGEAIAGIGAKISAEADRVFAQDAKDRAANDAEIQKSLNAQDESIRKRRVSVARSIGQTNYEKTANEKFNAFRVDPEATNPEKIQEFVDGLNAEAQQAESEFLKQYGDPEQSAKFFQENLNVNRSFAATLNKQAVVELDNKVQGQISLKVNEIRERVKKDPSSFLAEISSLDKVLRVFEDQLDTEKFRAVEESTRDGIAVDAVDSYLDSGDMVKAEEFLNNPHLSGMFKSPSTIDAFEARIERLRKEPPQLVYDAEFKNKDGTKGANVYMPKSLSFGYPEAKKDTDAEKKGQLADALIQRIADIPKNIVGAERQARIDQLTRIFSGSGVTVNNQMGTDPRNVGAVETEKARSKKDITFEETITNRARIATETQVSTAQILNVLEAGSVTTGTAADFRVGIGKMFALFGVDLSGIDLIGNPAAAEILDRGEAALTLNILDGLKAGRSSQQLIRVAQQVVPGLALTPEGNIFVARILNKIADRDIMIAEMRDEFLADPLNERRLSPFNRPSFDSKITQLAKTEPILDAEFLEEMKTVVARSPKSFSEVIADYRKKEESSAEQVPPAAFPTTPAEVKNYMETNPNWRKLPPEQIQNILDLSRGKEISPEDAQKPIQRGLVEDPVDQEADDIAEAVGSVTVEDASVLVEDFVKANPNMTLKNIAEMGEDFFPANKFGDEFRDAVRSFLKKDKK